MTSISLGSSIWSATAVLSAFMTGLALGNGGVAWLGKRLVSPLRAYVAAELSIAAGGVVAVLSIPVAAPRLLALVLDDVAPGPALQSLRFSIAFIILLLPAVAMGATLPILTKVLHRSGSSYTSALGSLYGWNTVGAVAGALGAELLLVGLFGLRNTALFASVLNLAAAGIVLRVLAAPHKMSTAKVPVTNAWPLSAGAASFLLLPFITGFVLLALEVVWFRYLLLAHVGTSQIFAVMLAVILAGIGSGSLVAARLGILREKLAPALIVAPLLAAGATVLFFHAFYLWLRHDFVALQYSIPLFSAAAALLMFPTAFLSGMMFPLFGLRVFQRSGSTTFSTGSLTLANTVGAALGSAVAGFILLPGFGVEHSLLILALAYVFVALLAVFAFRPRSLPAYAVIGIASVTLFLVFPNGTVDATHALVARIKFPGEKVLKVHEGLHETLQYLRSERFGKPASHRLVTNGFSMSGTIPQAQRYMRLFVYLPYALRERFENVLLVSYGVGNTAHALTLIPEVKTLDIVDLSRDVIEQSHIIHDEVGVHPLGDGRVRVHIEDGRFFLQTTDRNYDLITAEPPPPKIAGVVNLYTREYFQLIHERLNPGGISTYWLPTHSLYDVDAMAIAKAYCLVFSDCSMWLANSNEFMLMGSRGGISRPAPELFMRPWNTPSTSADLSHIALEDPAQLGALFVADSTGLAELLESVPPLTDDHPHRLSSSIKGLFDYSPLLAYWHDVMRRRGSYADSDYVRHLIPEPWRSRAIDRFAYEDFLNPAMYRRPGFNPLEDLVNVLTDTSLEQLPLWMLGSSWIEQGIVASMVENGAATSETRYVLAKHFLAQRRYGLAVDETTSAFAQGKNRPMNAGQLQFYFVSSALAGRESEAKAFYQAHLPLMPQLSEPFIAWFEQRFFSIGAVVSENSGSTPN